jgi:hypothetical protein
MTVVIERNYNAKDVDMLIGAATITESAIAQKKFLQTKRSNWADPYFENFKDRIQNATQNFLGVDNAKQLRIATQTLTGIQKVALEALSQCKVQLEEDYKSNKPKRNEVLNQLGFKSYFAKAQKKDQEALVNLLFQFKTNMTANLRTEVVAQGMMLEAIDEIVGYADSLHNANITQETFKGQRKELTAAGIKAFNEIHDEAISICRIATRYFKEKPAIKDQFSFSKVLKALNGPKAPKKKEKEQKV